MLKEERTTMLKEDGILTTQRLILRPWKESDAESLYEYAKDSRVGTIVGWPVDTDIEKIRFASLFLNFHTNTGFELHCEVVVKDGDFFYCLNTLPDNKVYVVSYRDEEVFDESVSR